MCSLFSVALPLQCEHRVGKISKELKSIQPVDSAESPCRRFSATGSFDYRPRDGIASLINVGAPRPPVKRLSALWTSGHRLESTVRYLGIEVDDALEISEQTEI